MKTEYLPQVSHPYVAEMNFFKEIKNVNGKAKTSKFKDQLVFSPFYFLLKIKEIENSGTVTVCFYENYHLLKTKNTNQPMGKKVVEKFFKFGKDGKYYEYIIFFDKIDHLATGRHRYAVFYKNKLIYEDYIDIAENQQWE